MPTIGRYVRICQNCVKFGLHNVTGGSAAVTHGPQCGPRAAIEGVIEADPMADHVREMMARRPRGTEARRTFVGSVPIVRRMVPRQGVQGLPAACVASRLRFGRSAFEIAFSREGRGGTRIIRQNGVT